MNLGKNGTAQKQQQLKSNSTKVNSKVKVSLYQLIVLVILVLVILVGVAGVGVFNGIMDNAPDIDQISVVPTGYKTNIYDKDGELIETLIGAGSNREYVTIEQIPEVLQKSVIAIEDERFYDHTGIDIKGIFRAFFSGLQQGEFEQGASTITQQLIKNQVFDGGAEDNFTDRFVRKLQEQQLSVQLEEEMDKDQILEYYLNTINLGAGTYGVQTAANRYFNKDVSELNLSESAVIAAIAQSPTNLNPIKHPENNSKRRELVLNNMLRLGYCSQEEYDAAINDNIYDTILVVNEEFGDDSYNSYFIDEIIEQVEDDLVEIGYTKTQASNAIYSGGLSIYTTLDSDVQRIIDEVYTNEENFPPLYNGYTWNYSGFPGSLGKYSYWELQEYRLSVQKSNGEQVHYQPSDFEQFFEDNNIIEIYENSEELRSKFNGEELNSFLNSRPRFTIYMARQEHADFFIEAFKEIVVEDGDTITGENYDLVIQPQSSFVIMDQETGHVSGIAGGRGPKTGNRTLNRATSSMRQPGSTFKPLAAYLPALDSADMTLASVIDDAPYTYPNGRPVNNWHSQYEGLTTLRRGLYRSMNVVTVKLLMDVGSELAMSYLGEDNLGFTTLDPVNDAVPSLALGGITYGVYNDELTAAYAAIANNGLYTEPIYYTTIVDHDGKTLIDNNPRTKQVMKESTAFLLTDAMEDVMTNSGGTGSGYRFRNSNMPVSGKTGTTSDDLDLWFSGFTPYYTASIWSGYDNNFDQEEQSYMVRIWRTIMENVHEHYALEVVQFEKPDSVVSANICTKSGKLAVSGLCDHASGGSTVKQEYFAKGTVPKNLCDAHVKVRICSESGKRANDYCSEELIQEAVYLVKEEPYTTSTLDTPYLLPSNDAVCDIHNALTEIIDDLLPGEDETEPGETEPDGTEPDDTNVTEPATTTPATTAPANPGNGNENPGGNGGGNNASGSSASGNEPGEQPSNP